MTKLEEYIKSYFGIINEDDLKIIISFFKSITIKKGEYLLKSGKMCNNLSFVQSGFLRMYIETENKEITQWISASGHFSADLSSFLFDTPSKSSIQALMDTDIRTISKDDYEKIGTLVPAWHVFEKAFILKCFILMEERIMSHLSFSAEERYELFYEQNRELFNQVPLQYIASMLGMTPETLSRLRKK